MSHKFWAESRADEHKQRARWIMLTVPAFPGQTISAGNKDANNVLAIQQRLNAVGCGPVAEDGVFGPETLAAVELFQVRSTDSFGTPLTVDGKIGPMTWAALFGIEIPARVATSAPELPSGALA